MFVSNISMYIHSMPKNALHCKWLGTTRSRYNSSSSYIYINIPSPQGQELYLFSPRQSFLLPIIVDCIYDWLFFSCNHQIVVYIYTEAKQGYTHKNRSYQEICKWRLSLGSRPSSIPWCYLFCKSCPPQLMCQKKLYRQPVPFICWTAT